MRVLGPVLKVWKVLVRVRVAVWLIVPCIRGWLTAIAVTMLLRRTSIATGFDCRIFGEMRAMF